MEILIESGDHDSGAINAQATRIRNVTPVSEGSYSVHIPRGGMYQMTIPCLKDREMTVTVDARKDSNYAGTAPSLEVFHIPGNTTVYTDTHTAAADTWETLTVTFTPTQSGPATVRMRSQCTSDNGNAYFDDLKWTT
jgi:hypothetical protein